MNLGDLRIVGEPLRSEVSTHKRITILHTEICNALSNETRTNIPVGCVYRYIVCSVHSLRAIGLVLDRLSIVRDKKKKLMSCTLLSVIRTIAVEEIVSQVQIYSIEILIVMCLGGAQSWFPWRGRRGLILDKELFYPKTVNNRNGWRSLNVRC